MIAYNAQTSYNQYKENSVAHARPEELTLMLFNGLVKFILRAQESIHSNRLEEAHQNILRAQDIVMEFINTLDHEYEVSTYMELIYDYLYRRLIDANIKKSNEILEEVLGFSKDLRDTWEQAIKLSKKPQKELNLSTTAQ